MNKYSYLLILLTLIVSLVWLAALYSPDGNLHIIACDVGQGDAILITHGSDQILVDAGKGGRVMDCLSAHMSFWDKTIEMIVVTHPQLDHYGGFNAVLDQFSVSAVLTTSIDSEAIEYRAFKENIRDSQTKIIEAKEGKSVKIGMMVFDIVAPSEEKILTESTVIDDDGAEKVLGSRSTNADPNELSIVAILSYGNFNALLTSDIGPAEIKDIINAGNIYDAEYIKIPHHGSRNGLTEELLEASSPEIAVISSGKNPWGHPHREVIELLDNYGTQTFRTDEIGSVEVVSDGASFWINI